MVERDVAAVVAHGLVNTLSVITGSASTLWRHADRLGERDTALLFEGMSSNIQLFEDVLASILDECSEAFADAALTMVLAVRSFETVAPSEREEVLKAIVDRSAVLHTGLTALVRGLSRETIAALDELRPRERTVGAR
jgi:K+-sensing histidine kinase KdpD